MLKTKLTTQMAGAAADSVENKLKVSYLLDW